METRIANLWNSLYDSLLGYVKKKGVAHEHAQDIVQDVFLKAFDNINTLKDQEKMMSWVFSIARNSVMDFYRKNKPMAVDLEYANLQTDIDEDKTAEFASCIHCFLPHLPGESREIIIWVELENFSQKELSKRMGLPYSTVKSKVQRARQRLRELIEACCVVQHDRFGNIIQYQQRVTCC